MNKLGIVRKVLYSTVASAAFLTLPVIALAIGIVTNGSFENGTNPGVFTTLSAGDSTTITGWTVNSGTIDYIGSYWQASDGVRSLDLNGLQAGLVSQSIPTVAGTKYFVNFDLSGNPDSSGDPSLTSPSAKVVAVSATGGATVPFTFDTAVQANDKTNMKWAPQLYVFTASGAATTLGFASTIAGAFGPALDNVSVRACVQNATSVIMSDTSTQVDGHDAVAVTPHPAWTASIPGATWIYSEALDVNGSSPTGTKTFTKTFTIIGTPLNSTLDIAADNMYTVSVNGNPISTGTSGTDLDNFSTADSWAIPASALVTGPNTLTITVTNPAEDPISHVAFGDPNPGGLLYKLTLNNNECTTPNSGGTNECKAAPAIGTAYMQSHSVKPGSTIWKNIVTYLASQSGKNGIFWAAHSCDPGFAAAVEAYVAAHI